MSIKNIFLGISILIQGIHSYGQHSPGVINNDIAIEVAKCYTSSGSYKPGEKIRLSMEIRNPSHATVHISEVWAHVRPISQTKTICNEKILLAKDVRLTVNRTFTIADGNLLNIPADATTGTYGIFISCVFSSATHKEMYKTFFRITEPGMLTVYDVKRDKYKGMDIFKLDGGMSAEFVVQKSLENLSSGISHTWVPYKPGEGPRPVYSTPQFLEKSIKKTIDLYNSLLGDYKEVETVIISTGLPSVPYLSRVLNAPVLPLHFLVSANSIKEIETIVDHSLEKGLSSYATLSNDPSVPLACAWIKLLDIPAQYLNFLKNHKVKNVILLGCNNITAGDNRAIKIRGNDTPYSQGSIYMMYHGMLPQDPDSASAVLRGLLVDFDEVVNKKEKEFINIADWEGSLVGLQETNFVNTIKRKTGIKNIRTITSESTLALYDLAPLLALAYINKNKKSTDGNNSVKGVILNPYMISNPAYEIDMGYVPLLYWQLMPAKSTINRISTTVFNDMHSYFPGTAFNRLSIWVNSSKNCGGPEQANQMGKNLKEMNYGNIIINECKSDEVWNVSDGMNSSCEKHVVEILQKSSAEQYRMKNARDVSITIQEMDDVVRKLPDVVLKKI